MKKNSYLQLHFADYFFLQEVARTPSLPLTEIAHPIGPHSPNRGWSDRGGQTQTTEPEHLCGAYRGRTAFMITVTG